MLQNLRLAMRRQIRRHSTRRSTSSSSRRRLGHLWNRLFRSGGRGRGHAPLLDPPGPTQITLGLHSYRTVGEQGPQNRAMSAGGSDVVGVDLPESPASPLSFHSVDSPEEEEDLSPVSRDGSRAAESAPPTPCQSDSSVQSGLPLSPQEASVPLCPPRASRKLVLELAVNLKGVSLRRYSPLGPLSPISPPVFPSSSQTPSTQPQPQGSEVTSPTEPLFSSVKPEDSDSQFTVNVPSRDETKPEARSSLCRFGRSISEEGGDLGRETLC